MLLIYGGGMATGIVCKDGVAVGADKRYAFSNLIASKRGKKVHLIADRIGWASTGIIADIQYVTRVIAANHTLYTLENQRTMSVRATPLASTSGTLGQRGSRLRMSSECQTTRFPATSSRMSGLNLGTARRLIRVTERRRRSLEGI